MLSVFKIIIIQAVFMTLYQYLISTLHVLYLCYIEHNIYIDTPFSSL